MSELETQNLFCPADGRDSSDAMSVARSQSLPVGRTEQVETRSMDNHCGWIKLHRKLISWEWFGDGKTLQVFLYLLLSANHATKRWQGIDVGPGQLVTGRHAISSATGISPQSVRTSLNRLKSTSEITIKPTNKFSLITICNWATYQSQDCDVNQQINQLANQQSTNNQPTTNQQLTTNKNGKNERMKEEREVASLHARPRFQPPELDEVLLQAAKLGLAEDEARKFFAYYASKGWTVGRSPMKSWHQALTGWKLRSQTAYGQHGTNRGSSNDRNARTCNDPNDYAGIEDWNTDKLKPSQ